MGYRRAWEYGDDDGISLGTAVAISGAFVSPNMGYMMSSPVVRFLMTIFNIRFGWWLGNPSRIGGGVDEDQNKKSVKHRVFVALNKIAGVFNPNTDFGRTYTLRSPRLSIRPIVEEAFGATDDDAPYVYLSDGGHFENLGLYEMVLRRCRLIVVSDGSTDEAYSFQSLGMAIRQIRVDMGIPIEFTNFNIAKQFMGKHYCAAATIRYSCVDLGTSDEVDGLLIYIKPTLIGDEPRDVLNYAGDNKSFPQEIIVDQFFGESQFESYRALGSHTVDIICGGGNVPLELDRFAAKASQYSA